MNCLLWILLLLGCCGNNGNGSDRCCDYENSNDRRHCHNHDNDCYSDHDCHSCDNMIQPRMNREYISPPLVPNRVKQDDECGCND